MVSKHRVVLDSFIVIALGEWGHLRNRIGAWVETGVGRDHSMTNGKLRMREEMRLGLACYQG